MKKSSKYLSVARKMPPLRHSIEGENFNIKHSEAARWLCSQPDIMQYVFSRCSSDGLTFDPESKTWRGKDYTKNYNAYAWE